MISVNHRVEQSLLDAAYKHSVDYVVVFRSFPRARSFWWRFLKPGFYHSEIWGYVPPGTWIRFDTAIEFISVECYADPPWALITPEENPTFLHYSGTIPHGKIRQPFFIGPLTCVTMAAAFLGVRLPFFCRTPFQLYKYLNRILGAS